ncbi:recombinase family protein [Mesorhizobium sp. CU2]|uniref:recombinase family protein n=1 Tax=unclassified Mesorhizobium TaxID=325217 RepID=UPI0011267102|nr:MULTISPECIES: recombinase family protein [unclassified Mesorhizobium]TPN83846.1 recombinase family protein [Mesorhizobium sp. CU3]TPO09920.1 recombinase family protein [Mesorhizobium sp. CU2]
MNSLTPRGLQVTSPTIGYARTSTVDQDAGLEAQQRDLKAAGCIKVFSEQLSSVAIARPQLEAALDYLREGDTLVVTKPDRLARSTADLLGITERLRTKGVTLRILSMQMDTSTPTGKLMLTMLGGIAEFERDLMLERQREGIAKAKADGKYKGRAPTARRKAADVLRLKAEGKTADAIVHELNVSRSSVFRILRSV